MTLTDHRDLIRYIQFEMRMLERVGFLGRNKCPCRGNGGDGDEAQALGA